MNVEILSPIKKLFSGTVDSVLVPGKNGSFHMLNNHAPVVSVLSKGKIELFTKQSGIDLAILDKSIVKSPIDSTIYTIEVEGGVIELKNNTLVILVE